MERRAKCISPERLDIITAVLLEVFWDLTAVTWGEQFPTWRRIALPEYPDFSVSAVILYHERSALLISSDCRLRTKQCVSHEITSRIFLNYRCRRDTSVGVATCYGLDGPGIESRRVGCTSPPVQKGSGAYLASYTMGTGSFPGVQRSGRGVNYPPHLAPK